MGNTAGCFCIGPPGNCPCIRRARESYVQRFNEFDVNKWVFGRGPAAGPFFDMGPNEWPMPREERDPMKAMG